MTQAGFLPAYVNYFDKTSDQLVLVDDSAQMSESWKFLYLSIFDRDIFTIVPHLLDLHLIRDCLIIGEYERLSAD